jgi:hypothetical protein
MRRRIVAETGYPFTWIDEVIEVTMNPVYNRFEEMSSKELSDFHQRFRLEARQAWGQLKQQTFCLGRNKKIKSLVAQYDAALQVLREQATINLEACPDSSPWKAVCQAVSAELDELDKCLHRRFSGYLPHDRAGMTVTPLQRENMPRGKIFCLLSVDQLAIIFKAADDIKLIVSETLTLIFKSVVPYLSTQEKEDPSWDSMRSKSYHPEEHDKLVTIGALEQIIEQIRKY